MNKTYLKINNCRWQAITIFLLLTLAQMSHADDYLEMQLEELLQVKVQGATLRDESLKTAPSSVTVFTHDQLDAMGVDYLHELMNMVPGFQVTRGGDTPVNYTYSARGRRLGVRAREIILVVDGRVFMDPRSSGADSAVGFFPLNNVERIEIIRGPGSAIYGSGAFTGVINIISRKQNRVALAAGSEQQKMDLGFSESSGDWALNIYAHVYEDKGQNYQLASGNTTTDPHRENLVDMNLAYRNTQVQIFNSEQSADNFYVLEKVNNAFNEYRHTSRNLNLKQYLNINENWHGNLSAGYINVEQTFHGTLIQQSALAGITNANPMLAKVLLGGEAYYAAFTNDITLSNKSSWQFGFDWKHEHETDAKAKTNYDLAALAARNFPISYYGDFDQAFMVGSEASRKTSGVYSQLLHQLTDSTRLTLGARYDYYQDIGNHLSPRIGLVHQINEHHSMKLLYGEAFRAPSMAETGLLNNPVVVGNPDLNNETVKTIELIWIASWNNLSTGAGFHHNQYENPIASGLIGTTRTYVNAEDSSNYGGGARIDWQISDHWLFRVSYGFMENLPDTAFREADDLIMSSLNYQQEKWNWNLSTNYQDERQYQLTQTQKDTLDDHWVTNSRLRYQLQKNTSVQFTIKNLLDEEYYSPSQGTGILGGIPHRGREWSLGVEWQY
jgi:outer membrane receptor protein involved in Fe transport